VIVLFGVLTSAAFLLAAASSRTGWTARLVAITTVLWVARPFLSVRTQVMTLLGFALVLWLWSRAQDRTSKVLWALPPLFLLWANLHGGFVAGLVLLGLLLAGSVVLRIVAQRWPAQSRRFDQPIPSWQHVGVLSAVLGLSALVTFLNPYGMRLHGEIYASLNDHFMIETLHEWQPVDLGTSAGRTYVLYLATLAVALLLWYRRWEPLRWLLLATFLMWSILHWRNVPFVLLLSVPLLAELMTDVAERLRSAMGLHLGTPKHWILAVTLGLGGAAVMLGPEHLQQVVRCGLAPAKYFEGTSYPVEAVSWIRKHLREIGVRPYNDYGLGGFLTWWLPERKVFIDGRMPAWRLGNRWIFYDYVALTAWDPPALGVLTKYGVDSAIVGRDTPLNAALAQDRNWRRLYEDSKVTIYSMRTIGGGP
jgi:hypothetical protein